MWCWYFFWCQCIFHVDVNLNERWCNVDAYFDLGVLFGLFTLIKIRECSCADEYIILLRCPITSTTVHDFLLDMNIFLWCVNFCEVWNIPAMHNLCEVWILLTVHNFCEVWNLLATHNLCEAWNLLTMLKFLRGMNIFPRCLDINSRCMIFRDAWFSVMHGFLTRNAWSSAMDGYWLAIHDFLRCLDINSRCMIFRDAWFSACMDFWFAMHNLPRCMDIDSRCMISRDAWILTRDAWLYISSPMMVTVIRPPDSISSWSIIK